MNKKKILILYDYFDPAYKAGGPIRSLVNLVKLTEEVFDFYILTSNSDHDGSTLQVEPDKWIKYGASARVQYLSKKKRGLSSIKKIISEVNPEVVYLNGMYSFPFLVYPLWILRNWKHTKIILAPRGMLQYESLSIKPIKKKIFLTLLKRFCLRNDIYWQVTTDQEKLDLLNFIENSDRISVIGNVPNFTQHIRFEPGETIKKKVFGTVALISPMKNIHLILEALATIPNELEYILYGPVKDQLYWDECLDRINELPSNIQVSYKGEIVPDEVGEVICGFDFYIQPSKSENFGHSIFEAFNQGVPVIISDQTPWRSLQDKKAGWDVNLKDPQTLAKVIGEAVNMDGETWLEYLKGAREVAEKYMEYNNFEQDYLELFT